MGKRAIEVQDDTQPGLQDKVTQEGLPTPSHLCMLLVGPDLNRNAINYRDNHKH